MDISNPADFGFGAVVGASVSIVMMIAMDPLLRKTEREGAIGVLAQLREANSTPAYPNDADEPAGEASIPKFFGI
ncbi:hypothetical protein GCM10011491_41260 [Brucella endophytica]|uniref:Uncharacterized protein n=1 Tax=Brucella endophytica TaxID=1963359 RepID=A0A916SP23_9HYPH|nr:hypothetical protein [Brucella endophytica]GGB09057.1 hypothetical protein GCM10011491_41260 [Brucella endophytica]